MWRKSERGADLRDVVEVLQGIGIAVMGVSARLDRIIKLLEEENDGEADA